MNHQLEQIEWVQYWAEDCTKKMPHVLLIGDSISVGYRSPVLARIGDRYGITVISTSKALDNPHFCSEIKALAEAEGFAHPIVHFNNGLHGFQLSEEVYRQEYRDAVLYLRALYPESRMILATSTPVTENGDPTTYAPQNERVLARNIIVKELAEELGLEVNDLYPVVDGDPAIRTPDGYHYDERGYERLADQIAGIILSGKGASDGTHRHKTH